MASLQANPSQPGLSSSTQYDEGPPADTLNEQRQNGAAVSHSAEHSCTTHSPRQTIRLIQCQVCNKILQNPTTLPCGYSICKACLPEARPRTDIFWPATALGATPLELFECPIAGCEGMHSSAHCALDITLNGAVTAIKAAVASYQSAPDFSKHSTKITVRNKWDVAGVPSLGEEDVEPIVLGGSAIFATYALAELGKLDYSSETSYMSMRPDFDDDVIKFECEALARIKEVARPEVDCRICFGLLLDPVTTSCGHTYCQSCILRILDETNLCPICRRAISVKPQGTSQETPLNKCLVAMINTFWEDLAALRLQAYKLEQRTLLAGYDIPVFVCSLSFPSRPLFLHVFEPRYRLMIRRAMEGDRTFGMVLSRPTPPPHDEPQFMQIGVLQRIVRIEYYPDGRSMLETIGLSRFLITGFSYVDGYLVAKTAEIKDFTPAQEEAWETAELAAANNNNNRPSSTGPVGMENLVLSDAQSQSQPQPHSQSQPHSHLHPSAAAEGTGPGTETGAPPPSLYVPLPLPVPAIPTIPPRDQFDAMPTRDLLAYALAFVRRSHTQRVRWLAARLLALYGACPEDAASFPWWFACVLPLKESQKYALLRALSVRERLKINCRWIVEWEACAGAT
ncbi:ATP-dependent protease La domain-containing protein [Nemania sp. FL0916]|nr:ATP-dependent protease La domain-containing protein [Nemania sp. FL0916]